MTREGKGWNEKGKVGKGRERLKREGKGGKGKGKMGKGRGR